MKNLKSIIMAVALLTAASATAGDYNRVSISAEGTYYSKWEASAAGFGLNYRHGFSLSKKKPMFIELGGTLSFNFEGAFEIMNGVKVREQFQNFNVRVPVNFTWRFRCSEKFYISPYAGINFQLNYLNRERAGAKSGDTGLWTDWVNLMKEDEGWNVFQMGWQLGVTFQFSHWFMNIQAGTSFIPAYKGEYYGYQNISFHNSWSSLGIGYEF